MPCLPFLPLQKGVGLFGGGDVRGDYCPDGLPALGGGGKVEAAFPPTQHLSGILYVEDPAGSKGGRDNPIGIRRLSLFSHLIDSVGMILHREKRYLGGVQPFIGRQLIKLKM